MSAVTFAEPLDEHMLEYPADADIAMFSSSSSTGFWISQEATMDDDSNTVTLDSNSNHSESIEVDMEPHDHDEEMTEYEMVDGGLIHDGDDIPDIEVADSSPTFSPEVATAIAVVDVAKIPQAMPSAMEHQPLLPASLPPPAHHHAYAPDAQEASHELHVAFHESYSPEPIPEGYPHGVASVPVIEGIFSESIVALEDSQGETVHTSVDTNLEADPQYPPNSDVIAEAGASEAVVTVPPEDDQPNESGHSARPVAALLTENANESVEEASDAPHLQTMESHMEVRGGEHYDHEDIHEAGDDPLQLSEGVYIDPPPPVLLSLASATEQSECCLFNQPTPEPNSHGSNTDSSASTTLLLLHDRPTLYYEPLDNVFAALRQEEAVRNIAELAEGEIVLDAYDLQLAISEDNIHVPEVTIHELNILHDASSLQGPLRLRLYALTPRFISRYNTLREQLARMAVSGEGHQADEQQAENDGDLNNLDSQTEIPHEEDRFQEVGLEAQDTEERDNENAEPLQDAAAQPGDEEGAPDYDGQHYHDEHADDTRAAGQTSGGLDTNRLKDSDGSAEGPEKEAHEERDDPSFTDHVFNTNDRGLPLDEPIEEATEALALDDATYEDEDDGTGSAEWDEYTEGDGSFPEVEQVYEEPRGYDDEQQPDLDDAQNYVLSDQLPHSDGGVSSEVVEHTTSIETNIADNGGEDADGEFEDDADGDYAAFGNVQEQQESESQKEPPKDLGSLPTSTTNEGHSQVSAPVDLLTGQADTVPTEADPGQDELLEYDEDEDQVRSRQTTHNSTSTPGVQTSSITSSKRTYDQFELEDEEGSLPSSPDSKRLRAV